jgi:hypothetical protein
MPHQFVIPFFGRVVGVFAAMKQVVADLTHDGEDLCSSSFSFRRRWSELWSVGLGFKSSSRHQQIQSGRGEPTPGAKAVGDIPRHESPHVIARGIPATSRWRRLTRQRSEVGESFLTRRRGAEITREMKFTNLVDLVIVRKGQPCSRLYGAEGYQANKHGDD